MSSEELDKLIDCIKQSRTDHKKKRQEIGLDRSELDELLSLLDELDITDRTSQTRYGDFWTVHSHPFAVNDEHTDILLEFTVNDPDKSILAEGLVLMLRNEEGYFWLGQGTTDFSGKTWFKDLPKGLYRAKLNESSIHDIMSTSGQLEGKERLRDHLAERKDTVAEQIAKLLLPEEMGFVVTVAIRAMRDSQEAPSRQRSEQGSQLRAAAFSSGDDENIHKAVQTVGRVLNFIDHVCNKLIERCSEVGDIPKELNLAIDKSIPTLELEKDSPLIDSIRAVLSHYFSP